MFSCKFAAYFQNTFSYEHLWTAASVNSWCICIYETYLNLLSTNFRFSFSVNVWISLFIIMVPFNLLPTWYRKMKHRYHLWSIIMISSSISLLKLKIIDIIIKTRSMNNHFRKVANIIYSNWIWIIQIGCKFSLFCCVFSCFHFLHTHNDTHIHTRYVNMHVGDWFHNMVSYIYMHIYT